MLSLARPALNRSLVPWRHEIIAGKKRANRVLAAG
jgi:hypothetical protein